MRVGPRTQKIPDQRARFEFFLEIDGPVLIVDAPANGLSQNARRLALLASGFRLALGEGVYINEESAFDLGGLGLSGVLSTSEPKALSR